MSAWGNLDNVLITGNVSSSTSRDYIDGYQTEFFIDVKDGDYIVFGGNKYQVQNVASNTKAYLTGLAATNSSNVDAWIQQGPKFIANVAFPANNYSIQNVNGVDRDEIATANGAANASHTGWVHFIQYEDALGQVRTKSETLVAMSKNFDSNVLGYVRGVGTGGAIGTAQDADDDITFPDS